MNSANFSSPRECFRPAPVGFMKIFLQCLKFIFFAHWLNGLYNSVGNWKKKPTAIW